MSPKGKFASLKQKKASPQKQESLEEPPREDTLPTPSIHADGQFHGLWKKLDAGSTYFIHEAESCVEFEDGKRFRFMIKGARSCGMDVLGDHHSGSLVSEGEHIDWSNGSTWHKVACNNAVVTSLHLVQQNTALKLINLRGQSIGDGGAWWIADALSNHANLIEMAVNLRKNGIGSRGAYRLASALEKLDYLASLDLSCNVIKDIGTESIARALESNACLRVLDLSSNSITDLGAGKVAGALRTNGTLRTLNLSCNDIGDVGAEQLGDGLKDNTSITALDLSSNKIQDIGAARLHSVIVESGMLITLDLSHMQEDIPQDLSIRPWQ